MSKPSRSRRVFLKDLGLVTAAMAAMGAADALAAAEGPATAPAGKLPMIKLGDLDVSRLILGSNQFFGFAHGPGGGDMKAFYTRERIMAVLDEAAGLGVTAVAAPCYGHWINLWQEYQSKGGKMKQWIAQPDGRDIKADIDAAAKGGAKAVFVQGLRADGAFKAGNFDQLTAWLNQIKGHGLPAGLASHLPTTHPEYQKRKLPLDFHFQCFYPNDSFKPEDRDKAVATAAALDKPVIGYKILAAGRLPAKEGFEFAFKHLRAKDGACVGVFPRNNPGMIAEDAALTRRLSAS